MKLNNAQRIVILVGGFIFVLMGLIPPYKGRGGYHVIMYPPSRSTLDILTLLVQWAMVVVGTICGLLLTGPLGRMLWNVDETDTDSDPDDDDQ